MAYTEALHVEVKALLGSETWAEEDGKVRKDGKERTLDEDPYSPVGKCKYDRARLIRRTKMEI